jgi:hypothetical protein
MRRKSPRRAKQARGVVDQKHPPGRYYRPGKFAHVEVITLYERPIKAVWSGMMHSSSSAGGNCVEATFTFRLFSTPLGLMSCESIACSFGSAVFESFVFTPDNATRDEVQAFTPERCPAVLVFD